MLVIGNGRMITQDASNPFLENGAEIGRASCRERV